jgi:hypothetical protein
MDSGVEFVAVDNPHATRLTLHILAAVAEHEREMIADWSLDLLLHPGLPGPSLDCLNRALHRPRAGSLQALLAGLRT